MSGGGDRLAVAGVGTAYFARWCRPLVIHAAGRFTGKTWRISPASQAASGKPPGPLIAPRHRHLGPAPATVGSAAAAATFPSLSEI